MIPKALERLNVVRERAGLTAENNIDLDIILKESACEMFGNGYRRMDLRRTGKLVEYNDKYNPHMIGTAAATIGEKIIMAYPTSSYRCQRPVEYGRPKSWILIIASVF